MDVEAWTLTALRLEAGRWVELGIWGDEREARIEPFDGAYALEGRRAGLRDDAHDFPPVRRAVGGHGRATSPGSLGVATLVRGREGATLVERRARLGPRGRGA